MVIIPQSHNGTTPHRDDTQPACCHRSTKNKGRACTSQPHWCIHLSYHVQYSYTHKLFMCRTLFQPSLERHILAARSDVVGTASVPRLLQLCNLVRTVAARARNGSRPGRLPLRRGSGRGLGGTIGLSKQVWLARVYLIVLGGIEGCWM